MAFNRSKHVRYWRMCSNILPDHYISADASRMFLGFFIIAAFDILDEPISEEDRQAWISWIYSCQCPEGGFRGFTGTHLREKRGQTNQHWDPPNLPNTFFALASLLVLGDDLSRLKRRKCLEWLPRLQRADGSFGELLSANETIEGGRDLRYCCCAAGIAYFLQDTDKSPSAFDEHRLINYIESCRNYGGGFGESPIREPHSGLNYCAIATLGLLKRLDGPASTRARGILESSGDCVRWIVERHTDNLYEEEESDENNQDDQGDVDESDQCGDPSSTKDMEDFKKFMLQIKVPSVVGFNGRDNKVADTCYCFWNAGALAVFDSLNLVATAEVKNYLLEKTQHTIGGFGKTQGAPPDVLHSYLGLAALSLFEEPGIKSLDPMLCISEQAVSNLARVQWRLQSK